MSIFPLIWDCISDAPRVIRNYMGCSKQIRRYSECQHDAEPKYGDHGDDDDENKACYEAQPTGRKNGSTTVTTVDDKYCSKACEAEFGAWTCCLCQELVTAPMERNTDNDLYHDYLLNGSTEPVQHIFCGACTVPSGRED
jgi:hypothetical protein